MATLDQNLQHPSHGLRIHAPRALTAVETLSQLDRVLAVRQTTVLLPEELAFATIDLDSGQRAHGTPTHLGPCLAGLFLAELLIAGVAIPGKHADTVMLTDRPTNEGTTLAAVARVVADKGPKIKSVLASMDRGLRHELGLDAWGTAMLGLVEAGFLTPLNGEGGLRYKVFAHSTHNAIFDRLRAAATGEGEIDPRTALLLSMMVPAGLLPVVAPERRQRRCARKRSDHALDGNHLKPIGKIARSLVAEVGKATAPAALEMVR
jgi:hypothetical protein